MNIAIYCGSQLEHDYLMKLMGIFDNNSAYVVKIYFCFYDILYDVEERKQYDIIIFGTKYQEQTLTVGEKLKQITRDVLLIYISNDTELAPKAVEIGAFRYIIIQNKDELMNGVMSAISEVVRKKSRQYAIITNRCYLRIPCDDIKYCYKSGKMSVIVTDYEEYRERISLYKLYKRLKDLSNKFIMIERGHIISISKVNKIEKDVVALDGGIRLPVGRTYKALLKDIKNEFKCHANNC